MAEHESWALCHPKDNVHMLINTINIIIAVPVSLLSWLDFIQEPSVTLCKTFKKIISSYQKSWLMCYVFFVST